MIGNTTVLLETPALQPSGKIESEALDLSNVVKLSLTAEAQYNMSKTWESRGLHISVYSSYDGTNWDITPYAEFNAPSNLSKTVRATISVLPDPAYIKCGIINQNNNETAYNCKLIARYSKSAF